MISWRFKWCGVSVLLFVGPWWIADLVSSPRCLGGVSLLLSGHDRHRRFPLRWNVQRAVDLVVSSFSLVFALVGSGIAWLKRHLLRVVILDVGPIFFALWLWQLLCFRLCPLSGFVLLQVFSETWVPRSFRTVYPVLEYSCNQDFCELVVFNRFQIFLWTAAVRPHHPSAIVLVAWPWYGSFGLFFLLVGLLTCRLLLWLSRVPLF